MSQQLSQNAMLASMGEKSQSLVEYTRRLPLSFWRALVLVIAIIWLVRSGATLFWLVFPTPEVAIPTKLAAPIETGQQVPTQLVKYSAVEPLKDVFGSSVAVVAVEPEAPTEEEIETQKTTSLRLKLHGVFASNSNEKGSAIIADGNKQLLYSVGDEIEANRGVKLARVLEKRVILNNKGSLESLWLFSEEDFKSKVTSRRNSPRRTPTRRTVNNQQQKFDSIRTSARPDQIPKNIGDVVRFSVHREGGKMVGYRIRPGRDRDLFNQVGLKANDIVTSVNGIEVNDPQQIRSVYKSMKTATEAQLTVLRNGNTQSITISLDSGA